MDASGQYHFYPPGNIITEIVTYTPPPPQATQKLTRTRTMDPTVNDVLSGRGAWFNRHPGNEHFRRMLEEKKVSLSENFPT